MKGIASPVRMRVKRPASATSTTNLRFLEQRVKLYLSPDDIADLADTPVRVVRAAEALCVPRGDLLALRHYFHRMAQLLEIEFAELYPTAYLARICAAKSSEPAFQWGYETDWLLGAEAAPSQAIADRVVEELSRDEESEWVWAVLAEMPDRIRRVVALRFGLESGNALPPRDICKLESISLSTYRCRYRHGLQVLSRRWWAEGQANGCRGWGDPRERTLRPRVPEDQCV